ncbi:O-methyltransferase [Mesorhizobium sp. INR15]|uniref:O-methyltransferase n=1 Tax=Mesorhizobium sp. INR15 TaxID=2654248 RepID=UPI0018966FC5|nr:hypothetical protein GA829_35865 [Mesorhizobium sp. INR15]
MITDPFAAIQAATRTHRRDHACKAYTFEDGRALTHVAIASGASRILELGTALGYTACCLASARPDAHVDTIEGDPLHAALARDNIAGAGMAGRITVHTGDFTEVLARLKLGYGLVFFDGYAPDSRLLDALVEAISPGGTLVCANLGLASTTRRRHLLAVLNNPERFSSAPSIEDGSTLVRRKFSL